MKISYDTASFEILSFLTSIFTISEKIRNRGREDTLLKVHQHVFILLFFKCFFFFFTAIEFDYVCHLSAIFIENPLGFNVEVDIINTFSYSFILSIIYMQITSHFYYMPF